MPATLSVPKVSNPPNVMRRVLLIAPVILAVAAAAVFASFSYLPAGQIARGVQVSSIDLGGQNQDAARAAIENLVHESEKREVILRYAREHGRDYTWKYHPSELGLSVDVDATLAKASGIGRTDAIGRITEVVGGSRAVHAVSPVALVDNNVLQAQLKKIAHTVNRRPINCRLSIAEDGGFKVVAGKSGSSIDLTSSAAAITKLWTEMLNAEDPKAQADLNSSGSDSAAGKPGGSNVATNGQAAREGTPTGTVDLVVAEVPPPITAGDVSQIDGAIGEMKTRIRGTPQRVRNVTIATSHINGTLLAPGATFSYNDVVGKRSEEGGYEKAIIFVKGRHVEDIGGGICQTASTLYNAVLRSGLKVVRRQPHCTPVVYVPYGLDATVAYGVVDFQFRNDTDYPVYIYAKANG